MYKRLHDLEAMELDGEWVILDAEHYKVTKLNEVGGLCWSLLRDGKSLEELVAGVLEQYDVDAELAEADIRAFLSQLLEAGLVQHAV